MTWDRGVVFPEFEAMFAEANGRPATDAGIEEMAEAAELDPGSWTFARHAAIGLEIRGKKRLDEARRGVAGAADAARADFAAAARLTERLIRMAGPSPALEEDLARLRGK
jgi:hypothetical protein